MTKNDIEKVISILLNSTDQYDMLRALKSDYPKFADIIEQRIREKDSAEEFEEEVKKKAKELYALDGNNPMLFMLSSSSGDYRYIEMARNILRND